MELDLASYIDHTLLKAERRKEDIIALCHEAKDYRFATVCIQPSWVKLAAEELRDSDVGITTVIGFPLGATTSFVKAAEVRDVIAHGATEVDMVINVGLLKSGDEAGVEADIRAVVAAADQEAIVKVIIETGLLTDEEKKTACRLAQQAGADFVKTSTGFGPGGATVEDIALMCEIVGPELGVKASGGVRTAADAEAVIQAGATRIGASAGIAIVEGGTGESTY